MRICKVEGCGRKYKARDLCGMHYRRVYELKKEIGPPGLLIAKSGERIISTDGYIKVLGQYEHILVAEKALGKSLPKGANVHHINANRMNNDPSNLVICPSKSYHWLIEMRGRAYNACGNADWVKCRYCGQYDDPKNMFIRKNSQRKDKGHPEGWHKGITKNRIRIACQHDIKK